jgi:hypothetical protein
MTVRGKKTMRQSKLPRLIGIIVTSGLNKLRQNNSKLNTPIRIQLAKQQLGRSYINCITDKYQCPKRLHTIEALS